MIAFLCFAVAIIYSGILGDIFTTLLGQLQGIVSSEYNIRSSNIILVTITLILPLSSVKNLSALAYASFFGFLSVIYIATFLCCRAWDGSYSLNSGEFVVGEEVLLLELPSFVHVSLWNFNFASLILMSNYGLAYVAHYNAPIFYRELQGTNITKFTKLVTISYIILITLYLTAMVSGYKTFGDSCQGNILLNYHPNDKLSRIARMATGCSILVGYPLLMAGARESFVNLATHFGYHSFSFERNRLAIVIGMLTIITLVAVTQKDVSVAVGVTGATMGSCIVYICPALIYTKAIELVFGKDSNEYQKACWSLILVPFGVVIAALGVYMSIRELFT
jgi:amino acid permease